ncbi:hypothetical protein QTP70_009449 [Hemibagrus guttatus]|uniref:Secreted protein n=1 Tax=Hemibagrus guttatus TaxID=175788 RepID=A0AAE0QRK6_9TELE|nr:hypothetical protein QTP70_009449 [Hemibagrus guttatus]
MFFGSVLGSTILMACTQAELEQQSSQTTSPGHYAPSDCDTVSKPYSMVYMLHSRHLSPPIPTCLHSLPYLFPTLSITLDC